MATEWEDLRKQAKKIENEIELQLTTFSKLGAETQLGAISRDDSPLLAENRLDRLSLELEETLGKLTVLNESMDQYTKRLGMNSGSAAMMHTLQRHRDILKDYSQEYQKIKSNVTQQRDRDSLLGGSRRDRENQNGGARGRTDIYLRENEHLRNADRLLDEQIGMAQATSENLRSQRGVFSNISNRMQDMTNKFPIINNLMGKINLKKKKNSIILGFVVSTCVVFILWWVLW